MRVHRSSESPAYAQGRRRGFTLLEMILAIVIAVGLLLVAISFYQQSANLRRELLDQSEKLASLRLIMDRMTSDLRTALPEPRIGFTGRADFMQFAHSDPKGMMLVTYEAAFEGSDTNALMIGFTRTEKFAVETPGPSVEGTMSTNAAPFAFHGDDLFGTNAVAKVEPTTRSIRHARFRFFDGQQWVETWSGVDAPIGVEISLGLEPMGAEEVSTNDFSEMPEVFRRIVFVPTGRVSAGTNEVFDLFEGEDSL